MSGTDTPAGEPDRDGDEGVVPDELETTREKLVYLYLTNVEESWPEEMKRELNVTSLNLYPVLNSLVSKGLVERDGKRYAIAN